MNNEEQTMSNPTSDDINPTLTMMNNACDAPFERALAQAEADEHADDAEIVRQLKRDMPEGFDVETHDVQPGVIDPLVTVIPGDVFFPEDNRCTPVAGTITGAFINQSLRNVRAMFEAKKKKGAEFKGARTRLDKLADQAVREFRAEFLSELSDEQALKVSRGEYFIDISPAGES